MIMIKAELTNTDWDFCYFLPFTFILHYSVNISTFPPHILQICSFMKMIHAKGSNWLALTGIHTEAADVEAFKINEVVLWMGFIEF